MASHDVLEETKKVLEMMSESEEKLSMLHEDLKQNKTLHQQTQNNLKQLREVKVENTTKLEETLYLKNNIEKSNQKLVAAAQLIYSSNSELCSMFNLLSDELTKNEELWSKNNELFNEKLKEYEVAEQLLKHKLQATEDEQKEVNKLKELEASAAAAELVELQKAMTLLEEKIEGCKNYIKSEGIIFEEEKNAEKEIEKIQGCIVLKEKEIDELTKLIEGDVKLIEKLKIQEDNLDEQIEKIESNFKDMKTVVDEYQLHIDELSRKIQDLESDNLSKEDKYNSYQTTLKNLEKSLTDLEENSSRTIASYEKSILDNDHLYERQKEINEQLRLETHALKKKIDAEHEFVAKIEEFLSLNKLTDSDLNAEIETKEEKQRQLKIAYEELKLGYDKRVTEFEAELKHCQDEIEQREEMNKKLQEDVDNLILEQENLKHSEAELIVEKDLQNEKLEKLFDQIKSLRTNLERAKAEKMKRKRKLMDIQHEKKIKVRNWDSESSMEGEDRRLADLVKLKMAKKLSKTQKKVNNTH